ncbi:PREDICTED: RING finger protein 150-like [Amphimedon queenslandica]|uniref:RING-type domain-containing protein n=1 Tax=Amphimedon queenslandica TaxID=400682 RepID=A0A1X7U7W6_AMPQE|nr:PREDICTED: RING finger protein 150-like [Amphimedon queenslandica]|eukprot:XP_019855671.1 PREDICTED: RING finger protein 150-like [Amphimedon queenslandica]
MYSLLFFFSLLLFLLVSTVSTKSLRHDNNARYSSTSGYQTISYYSSVTFSDDSKAYTRTLTGQVAGYSNLTSTPVRGSFYAPGDIFNTLSCIQERKRSPLYSPHNISAPFILVLRLGECDHYSQAKFAQDLGASGVLFHAPQSKSSLTSYLATSLDIVVAFIKVPDATMIKYKTMLSSNATVTLRVRSVTSSIHASQTFYFVVFAFSVLVLLSLTWFSITYIRRCHQHFSRKYQRRRQRRETSRAMSALPTKKYKISKDADSASISSSDEPTCAVCLENFKHNDIIRPLPCSHEFHKKCIDPWLESKGNCPLCKSSILHRQTNVTVSLSVPPSTEEPAAVATGANGEVFELMAQNSSTELIPSEEGQEGEGRQEEEEGRSGRSLSSSVSTSDPLIN